MVFDVYMLIAQLYNKQNLRSEAQSLVDVRR